jgi:predicted RNase H-like HicB family nuclease
MERPEIALTAVFLRRDKGYVGFVEELPNVNCHAGSLDEARASLRSLVAVVFDEERRNASELTAGKELVREPFTLPLTPSTPRRAPSSPRKAG